jgi:hypothetical protein
MPKRTRGASGGNVVSLSEGGEGERKGGALAGGVLELLAGGPSDLQRIVDEHAIIIADQTRALASKTAELRAKIQAANDLVAVVREASLGGADAVEALLPAVGQFYTRPKDACSVCKSTDAVAFTVRTAAVVCSTGCGVKRQLKVEPTPLLLNKQAHDAKQATFVFLYSRGSTLFVPPDNLRQRKEVLDRFVEQYFAHLYVAEGRPVIPGAGDIFLAPGFYVKLGPANTRLVGWEQEWSVDRTNVEFVSPRQLVSDIRSVLSSKPDANAVILTNDAVDFGDCVHHFRDFLVSFTFNQRQRLFFVTRRSGSFATCSTYCAEDLLMAIDGRHQFVNVPFHTTFFLRRMWEGMYGTLRAAFFDPQRPANRQRSLVEIDYSVFLRPPDAAWRSFFRM